MSSFKGPVNSLVTNEWDNCVAKISQEANKEAKERRREKKGYSFRCFMSSKIELTSYRKILNVMFPTCANSVCKCYDIINIKIVA